jgi:hypothetical protein
MIRTSCNHKYELKHNKRIDRAQTSSRVREKQRTQVSKGDTRFNLKFTPTKEATSPLRIPQREDYYQEPLFLTQSPQRKIGAH